LRRSRHGIGVDLDPGSKSAFPQRALNLDAACHEVSQEYLIGIVGRYVPVGIIGAIVQRYVACVRVKDDEDAAPGCLGDGAARAGLQSHPCHEHHGHAATHGRDEGIVKPKKCSHTTIGQDRDASTLPVQRFYTTKTHRRHRPSFFAADTGKFRQQCRQLPDPEITSPNSCHVLPSNFSICICLIGAKSLALVEITMPGSNIGSFKSWILAACFIRFSRDQQRPVQGVDYARHFGSALGANKVTISKPHSSSCGRRLRLKLNCDSHFEHSAT
jgi:hypothetical protein